MAVYHNDPNGWEIRFAKPNSGIKSRVCQVCGKKLWESWWRGLGPTKSSRMVSDRRRVILCHDCVKQLTIAFADVVG